MSNKIIEVIVSPTGATKIETKGFTGAECQQASDFLEKALGPRQSEQLTAEYHTEQSADIRQQQRS